MGSEEEITRLLGLIRSISNNLIPSADELPLPKSQLRVLEVLAASGKLTMTELARQLSAKLSMMTAVVDRLTEHGLVERERGEDDRRVVRVRLSEEGRKLVDQRRRLDVKRVKQLLGALTEDERGEFLRLLERISTRTRGESRGRS